MSVPAELVKKLREMSGAPMMECKKALEEGGGDLERAFTVLRKRGQAAAAKKAGRAAHEGIVGSYIHPGSKIGVIVEVNCETDFVARTPEFQELAHDLAMQICATDPRFICKEDVTPSLLDKEKEFLREQAATTGKPPDVVDRIDAVLGAQRAPSDGEAQQTDEHGRAAHPDSGRVARGCGAGKREPAAAGRR